jgi:hypothetical protein
MLVDFAFMGSSIVAATSPGQQALEPAAGAGIRRDEGNGSVACGRSRFLLKGVDGILPAPDELSELTLPRQKKK